MIKFLVVDDSVFSRKVTGNLLKKCFDGISVEYAPDGEAGLKKYDEFQPDCVFVDLLMPKIGGKELIRLLKAKGCKNIVVLSADVQTGVREEIEALGVAAFLNKPLTDKMLQELSGKIKDL